MPRAAHLVLALWAALPLQALAWPVDRVLRLEKGQDELIKLASFEWAEVEDAKVLSAEKMPAGELLLSGLAEGQTLVLLYDEGKLAVWRVRVGPKQEPASPTRPDGALSAAKSACPGLKLESSKLTAAVSKQPCAKALAALFQTDAFTAGEVELNFEVDVLQTRLKALSDSLGAKLSAHYLGSTLVLEGRATAEEHRRALWTVFRHGLGRIHLEDRVERSSSTQPSTETP